MRHGMAPITGTPVILHERGIAGLPNIFVCSVIYVGQSDLDSRIMRVEMALSNGRLRTSFAPCCIRHAACISDRARDLTSQADSE
jgi:hypothetical protein